MIRFYVGLYSGLLVTAGLFWWLTGDCETRSPQHICMIHVELTSDGFVHLVPLEVKP